MDIVATYQNCRDVGVLGETMSEKYCHSYSRSSYLAPESASVGVLNPSWLIYASPGASTD